MITVKLHTAAYYKDIDRFVKKSHRDFKMAIIDGTNEMHKMAKKKIRQHSSNSKVRSGTLTNNIHQKIIGGGYTGEIVSHASYSQAYEEGTRPHIIRIRSKKVLAGPKRGAPSGWKSVGQDYATYGTKVRHPGTQPRPFMYPAWLWGWNKFEKRMKLALN